MQNLQTLKESLISLFSGKNTKAYSKLILSRPELQKQISDYQQQINTQSISETLWCIINESLPLKCECGGMRQFNTFNLGYREFCGSKCLAKNQAHSKKISEIWKNNPDKLQSMIHNRNKTNLKKYGFANAALNSLVREKTKQTNLQRYGTEFPLQSDQIQKTIRKRTLDKYGVEYPFQSQTIRQKSLDTFNNNHPNLSDKMQLARQTFIDKHGGNPFSVQEIKDKIYDIRKEKYGYVHALQSHLSKEIVDILENKNLFIENLQGLTLAESGEKLGVSATTVARRAAKYNCREIFSVSSRSKWEFKIRNFLLSLGLIEGIDFIQGDRSILNGKELDFYFPKIKAAIEVGSVFWHSEISAGRKDTYHYEKWQQCQKSNINLFQYWDFELSKSWQVIESKIKYLFGKIDKTIGARKIRDFKIVTLNEEKEFLFKNHIQGFSGDRKKTFGAYYENKLVGVMALAVRPSGVEIVRYATDLTANYPGLFSRLLKYSLHCLNIKHTDVFSYSDNRHSSGNVYQQSGFELIRTSLPNYYYTQNYHNIENKKKFTKQKIKSKFNIQVGDRTEWQIMQDLGYDRIWDAGKKLWKITYKQKPAEAGFVQ